MKEYDNFYYDDEFNAFDNAEELDAEGMYCIMAVLLFIGVVLILNIDIFGIFFSGIEIVNNVLKGISNFVSGLAYYLQLDKLVDQVHQLF